MALNPNDPRMKLVKRLDSGPTGMVHARPLTPAELANGNQLPVTEREPPQRLDGIEADAPTHAEPPTESGAASPQSVTPQREDGELVAAAVGADEEESEEEPPLPAAGDRPKPPQLPQQQQAPKGSGLTAPMPRDETSESERAQPQETASSRAGFVESNEAESPDSSSARQDDIAPQLKEITEALGVLKKHGEALQERLRDLIGLVIALDQKVDEVRDGMGVLA